MNRKQRKLKRQRATQHTKSQAVVELTPSESQFITYWREHNERVDELEGLAKTNAEISAEIDRMQRRTLTVITGSVVVLVLLVSAIWKMI
ncbi:hypothetical protein EC844_12549 [Acinetobacter calcoaceticus]|uniref:Uncharacterized protein n=1 Tax=Acinetobacter calcoaceticus TaxID=471 RepID=A0A4R1XHD8_ACICA|nr:hypothetical protein EC844_12549 [Acinetobacter calcoaceticus]